jgi:hypothetical protein
VKFLKIFFLALLALAAVAQTLPVSDEASEQQLLQLVNLDRAKEGLTSLRMDAKLQEAARQHSQKMAGAHQLSHQFGDEPVFSRRLENAGAHFSSAGENVAFDQTVEGANDELMHSPPHRANILNPKFNAIGIGIVRGGGDIWVTEDFAHVFESVSAQQARDEVVAAFLKARRDAGAGRVKLVNEKRLQASACNMAAVGRLDTQSALAIPGVRKVAAYSASDLSQLPDTARKMAADSSIAQFAVGACFATSTKYPAGMYWVSIAGY